MDFISTRVCGIYLDLVVYQFPSYNLVFSKCFGLQITESLNLSNMMITGPIPDLSGLIDLRECFYIFTVHLLYRLCDLTVI